MDVLFQDRLNDWPSVVIEDSDSERGEDKVSRVGVYA
jgi:hypothetical protein